MTKTNAANLSNIMDAVFDVQAALKMMSKRLSAVGDYGGPDESEIHNLSRVVDLCVRSLDGIAEGIELAAEAEAKEAS